MATEGRGQGGRGQGGAWRGPSLPQGGAATLFKGQWRRGHLEQESGMTRLYFRKVTMDAGFGRGRLELAPSPGPGKGLVVAWVRW